MNSQYVFVYGTLKQGGRLHERLAQHRVTFIGEAERHGAVIGDVGFPVMMHSTKGVVHGELFRCTNIDEVLETLDFVEGFFPTDPSRSLYRRELLDVDVNGQTYKAWCYIGHSLPLVARAQENPVPSGRWVPKMRW